MSTIANKIASLGLTLPVPSVPVAAYVPYTIAGNLVFISGQLPIENGQIKITGKLGAEIDIATGQQAAKLCALNILAHLNTACGGDLDKVARCIKLGGFVACTPDFSDQPQVINGASELMQQIFGAEGQHARFAVGTNVLPRNAAVEIEAVFALKS